MGYLDFAVFGDAIWFVFVTITSVGYGNIIPCTSPGRFITLVCAIYGAFLLALTVTVVALGF
jgi:hypothetical protein